MVLAKFTILGLPVCKKNNSIMANGAFITNPKAIKWEKHAKLQILSKWKGQTIDTPCNVKMIFYLPDFRRRDLSNLIAAPLDVLVNSGVLKDDNWRIVRSHDGSTAYLDRENPRCEIEITKV